MPNTDRSDVPSWPPEKRVGPPSEGVLDDPEKRRQTGRLMPDVWQDQVTDDSMPSPKEREDGAQLLNMDP